MTRLFSKVSPAVWGSKRFMGLPTNDCKLLYLYLLSNEHMTSAGCYRLKEGYAVSDLGWQVDGYRVALALLVEADLIAHDEATSEIYIRRWFKHNGPQNEKHAQGCQRMIGELDSQPLAEIAMSEFLEANQNRMNSPTGQVSTVLRNQLQTVKGGRSW